MPDIKRFIGFDLGAESGRCIVATLEGGKLSLSEVHRFPTHNLQDRSSFHWDILAINREIVEGLVRAGKVFGPDFDGIACDTWGVDYVLVDPDGRPLGYPYHYRDSRTDRMMEKAFRTVPREALYAANGIQFAQFNTLFQLLAEQERARSLLDVADAMLLMPDYLNFFLSGERRSEFTIASTTGIADPKTRDWCWELIDRFGLPRNIFPAMIEPGTILGTIRADLAEKTGINPATRIIASAGHDTASAVASVPAAGNDWAFLSSGTWSLVGIELPAPVLSSEAMACNFTNEGGVRGTTRFLKNIIGLWPIQECRRTWLEEGQEYTYAQLSDLARQEGLAGAWVDLNDPRFLKPGGMPGKIISYLQETGQKTRETAGFIIGVVLESLAFSYREAVRDVEKVVGRKVQRLHAVGGGIQNERLAQFTADAIGLEVHAGPVEGTIAGNIGVQAMATGAVEGTDAWRKIVAASFGLKTYRPEHAAYFDTHESGYRKILRTT
jgi:rhamnulokinase